MKKLILATILMMLVHQPNAQQKDCTNDELIVLQKRPSFISDETALAMMGNSKLFISFSEKTHEDAQGGFWIPLCRERVTDSVLFAVPIAIRPHWRWVTSERTTSYGKTRLDHHLMITWVILLLLGVLLSDYWMGLISSRASWYFKRAQYITHVLLSSLLFAFVGYIAKVGIVSQSDNFSWSQFVATFLVTLLVGLIYFIRDNFDDIHFYVSEILNRKIEPTT